MFPFTYTPPQEIFPPKAEPNPIVQVAQPNKIKTIFHIEAEQGTSPFFDTLNKKKNNTQNQKPQAPVEILVPKAIVEIYVPAAKVLTPEIGNTSESPEAIPVPKPKTDKILAAPTPIASTIEKKPAKINVETIGRQSANNLKPNKDPKTMDKFPVIGDYTYISIIKGNVKEIKVTGFFGTDGRIYNEKGLVYKNTNTKLWNGKDKGNITEYVINTDSYNQTVKKDTQKTYEAKPAVDNLQNLNAEIKAAVARGESIEIALKNFEINNPGYEHAFKLFTDPKTRITYVTTILFKNSVEVRKSTDVGSIDVATGRISINNGKVNHSNVSNWNQKPKIVLNRANTPSVIAPKVEAISETVSATKLEKLSDKNVNSIERIIRSGGDVIKTIGNLQKEHDELGKEIHVSTNNGAVTIEIKNAEGKSIQKYEYIGFATERGEIFIQIKNENGTSRTVRIKGATQEINQTVNDIFVEEVSNTVRHKNGISNLKNKFGNIKIEPISGNRLRVEANGVVVIVKDVFHDKNTNFYYTSVNGKLTRIN